MQPTHRYTQCEPKALSHVAHQFRFAAKRSEPFAKQGELANNDYRVIVGSGAFRFDWIRGWGRLPHGVRLGDVPAVAVDSRDRLFVFHRGEPPILVLDQDGTFISSWGSGLFKRPHGIFIAADDSVYCVDDEGQSIRKFTPDGRQTLEIQGADQAATTGYQPGYPHTVIRSAPPFCYPTDGSESPDGEQILVSDGYGNARLHRFSRTGKLLGSFGDPGHGPSQFVIPHGIHVDPDGTTYVSDRENERVQIFGADGGFLDSWPDLNCPNNLTRGRDGYYYVAELGRSVQGPPGGRYLVKDAIPARVTVRDSRGKIVAEWRPPPAGDGLFFAPHGIAVDSRGDLYIGEVVEAHSGGLVSPGQPTLHKFVRVESFV
jgi:DNA-binding beta-propeller fold protein YncE